jgi:hypothetical protein
MQILLFQTASENDEAITCPDAKRANVPWSVGKFRPKVKCSKIETSEMIKTPVECGFSPPIGRFGAVYV